MRIARVSILLLAVVALLAVLPGQAAEKIKVTSVDRFDAFGLYLGEVIGEFFDYGTFVCPGTEPTLPCPVGSRMRIRGIVYHSRHSSSDPRLNGWSTFDYNANVDANGEGPSWGKWRIDVDGGGVWEGVYNGGKPFGERVEFHGTGASVDGLLLKLEAPDGTLYGSGIAFEIPYEGYILDPHEKK
jgi:hypothetical protein